MNKLIRQTIYFLLITLVINAGGWTFNNEAVADVWFDEQHSLAADDDHASVQPEATQTDSPKIPCNHWCHAIGHFVGLHSQSVFMTLEFASEFSNQQSIAIQLYSPDSRFRPPRLLS